MLIKKIPEAPAVLFDELSLEKGTEVTSLATGTAANAKDFNREQMQARRLRRQFRMSRTSARRTGGWAISAW